MITKITAMLERNEQETQIQIKNKSTFLLNSGFLMILQEELELLFLY